ncbi:unnamed protein product [Moneuplotes crassus]|uniref:Uncharacterized protein n=2 Tax=Euplotes crassus TaxID=5936 RepID=A0AAD1X7G8_EUPCR|nr:unnamed protein product [Moneuplotes crassus]
MKFHEKVAKVIEKAREEDQKPQRSYLPQQQIYKKLKFYDKKFGVQIIDKLMKKEKDLKSIKNYNKFWQKRNKELIQEKIKPSLSHQALLTQTDEITEPLKNHMLPYIKTSRNDHSRWLNDTFDETLKMLEEANLTRSLTRIEHQEKLKVPEVQDSMHVLRNKGDYYVQKSLLNSIYCSTQTGMFNQRYKDLVNARDLFMDKDGKIDVRAAKEGLKKDLDKNLANLLQLQAKKRKRKREKKLKKLERKSKLHEYERILQSYEKNKNDFTREYEEKSLALPQVKPDVSPHMLSSDFPINLTIRRDESFIKENSTVKKNNPSPVKLKKNTTAKELKDISFILPHNSSINIQIPPTASKSPSKIHPLAPTFSPQNPTKRASVFNFSSSDPRPPLISAKDLKTCTIEKLMTLNFERREVPVEPKVKHKDCDEIVQIVKRLNKEEGNLIRSKKKEKYYIRQMEKCKRKLFKMKV